MIALFALLLLPGFAGAQTAPGGNDEAGYGMAFPMNVAGSAGFLAFDNPPLPILQNREGSWKVSLQPAYLSGKVDRDSPFDTSGGNGAHETGKYKGWGGAASFSYGLSDHWSFYLLVFGSSIKNDGDFVEQTNGTTSGAFAANSAYDSNSYRMSGVKSSFVGAAPTLSYRFGRPKDHGTTWNFFFGPCLINHSYSATVHEFDTSSALVADYDVSIKQTNPGPMVGLQAGIDVGESWKLNPFAILGGDFGSQTKPSVTAQRTPASGVGSSHSLAYIAAGQGPIISQGGANVGLNVVYKPWNLSVNVTAPFFSAGVPIDKGGSHIGATEISLAWAFGDYIK